ncbi:MAG TPA: ATP-binding protein [Longimicrobiales bacterium]
MMHPLRLLRWLYLGRLTLTAGIFAGVLLVWRNADPAVTLVATLVLLLAIGVTLLSAWHTHVLRREPGSNFLYGQVVFDTLVVTAVVHLTGGSESDFAPLYIVVIAVGALLLPLPGGVLVGGLASIVYFADVVWGHAGDPQGTVFVQIGLFAVMALVTGYLGDRLRQAGAALGEVESELRQLRLDTDDVLEAIDTGVVMVDGSGVLAYLNRAAESLLGLEVGEGARRPALEELDRRAPGLGELIARTASSRVPVRWYETRITERVEGPGGGEVERVVGVRTTVLEREGEAAPWVTAVIQDVTDGRRAEELHRRAARLQAVAELAASLAHEIKNPLASIRSAVEQLAAERVAEVDRVVLERLVLTESDRLSRLLSEFIEFSRVTVNERAVIDLAGVTAEAIGLVKQHPDGADGVRIEFGRSDAELRVEGDEDLLHRAIFNLVLNAVQHAGAGGEVRVELGRVAPADAPPGLPSPPGVRLVVSDNGPGIAAEVIPRIFDPFFTTRERGTGLGLSVVHRAVEAHDGAIFVDGGPGRGARFTVYLPAYAGRSD